MSVYQEKFPLPEGGRRVRRAAWVEPSAGGGWLIMPNSTLFTEEVSATAPGGEFPTRGEALAKEAGWVEENLSHAGC